MNFRSRFTWVFVGVALFAGPWVPTAYAVDGNWNVNNSGFWSTATNWTSDPNIPGGAGSIVGLNFDISGSNRTVTIDTTSRTVGTLTIGDPNSTNQYILAASGGGTLIMDNSGSGASIVRTGTQNVTINAPLVLNENTALDTGSATNGVILGGSVTGVGSTLTRAGSGLLSIANNNTHTANISSASGLTLASTATSPIFNGNLSLSGGTLTVSSAGTTLSGSGLFTISGGTTVNVPNSGAGTIIDMDQRWNGNFSTTLVSASGQTITSNGDVTLGASLTVSNKLHMVINGDIGEDVAGRKLTVTNNGGTSTLTLGGNNSFSGGLQINQGGLNINSAAAIGTGTLTLNASSGVLNNTSGSVKTLTTNNVQAWNQNFTFTGTDDLNMGTGAVTISAGRTVTVSGGKLTVGGDISGEFSLNKAGAGTLTLNGTSSTFGTNAVATVHISGGTLEVAKLSNKGVASSIGDANADYSLRIGNGATLRYLGGGDSTNYRLQYQGGGTATIESSGSGALNFTSTQTLGSFSGGTAQTLILGGTNADDNTFSPLLANNGAGVVSLTKQGGGKWILTNTNNTYTGATTVNDGTLLVNGSLAAGSAVTVNTGGTLGGTGTIGGTILLDIGGTMSPGASIESLASGSNTWNGGSLFDFEFSTDGTGIAGTAWDLLSITGSLDLTSASSGTPVILNLFTMSNASTPGLLSSWDPNVNHTWAGFVTTTTGVTNFAANKFNIVTTGFQNTINGTFSVALNGNNLDLKYTAIPIPEPSSLMMLSFGMISLWMFRKHR